MELTSKMFKDVVKSETPVLVEFWGSWCPPCQWMKTVLNKLENDYKDKLHIAHLNIDRNPEPGQEYQIAGVPTYIIFQNGEILHRDVGAKSEQQLKNMLDHVLTCDTKK